MLQAKSKNNKTYKNMVAVSNLYQYYWQTLNSLKVPTNKVTNQQYITQLVTNTINAELQYSPEVQQVTNGIKYELEFMANNKFILTTYTGNGNCIINVLPGGANISCSVGICGTANLLYTDTYNFY